MALLVVLGFPVKLFFETPDASQVLLLLEKHAIALQVGVLDSLLALVGQLLDGLLLLFVKGDALLLVLQQTHQVVVLLSPRLKLGRDAPQLVLRLPRLTLEVQHLGLGVAVAHPDQVQLLGQQIDLVLLLGSQLVMGLLDKLKLLSHYSQLALLLL